MVCGDVNHKIHRYTSDGRPLTVITLTDDIKPRCVTRHGDQFVVTDWNTRQVVVIDKDGQAKTRYKDYIHGASLGGPFDIITDKHGRILICDHLEGQVLLLNKKGDAVRQLLRQQHVGLRFPFNICLGSDQHKLYVYGNDEGGIRHVFVFDYFYLRENTMFTENITMLELKVKKTDSH